MKRCLITLIHGTFAQKAEWTSETSTLCKTLSKGLNFDVSIDRVTWSGRNSLQDRISAADSLAKRLSDQLRTDPDCRQIVIGHSHGGSILAHALTRYPRLAKHVAGVFLATPFIDARPRRYWFLTAMIVICTLAFSVVLGYENAFYLYMVFGHPSSRTVLFAGLGSILVAKLLCLLVVPFVMPFLLLRAGPTRIARRLTTCRLPAGHYLFVRTTGDEANTALATAQFASWLFSKLISLVLRPLPWNWKIKIPPKYEVPLRFKVIASTALCSLLLMGATSELSLANWIGLLGLMRDYGGEYSYNEIFVQFFTGFLRAGHGVGLALVIQQLLSAGIFLIGFLYFLLLTGFFLFTWFAYRSFGRVSFWAAMLIELAVEPVPVGSQNLVHISWSSEGMSHSSPYQNRRALEAIRNWINEIS
jgi:pimeloyl-ACP methyl ester carboxylesterase